MRCEPDDQREPSAIQHAAEKIAVVAVNAKDVLRLTIGTAEQVDARRGIAFDVRQRLDRVMGCKRGRQEGNGGQPNQHRQPDHSGAFFQQVTQRVLP